MKEFFKQLFCRHKFKYTKLNKITEKDGVKVHETYAVCVYCGKGKVGYIYV